MTDGGNVSDTVSCTLCANFLFFLHFDVNYDLLLIRGMATWDLFVNAIYREELEF